MVMDYRTLAFVKEDTLYYEINQTLAALEQVLQNNTM
jgi:hypothetical protein